MRSGFFVLLLGAAAASAGDRYLPADAVVDVSLAPYFAIPDDGNDDTMALQKAITDQVETGRSLYLPSGVYDISDALVAKNGEGTWRAQLTLQGQNREKTILKLKDGAAGFGDKSHPKAVVTTASHWGEGDHLDGGGNKAFRNYLFDLTIDTGAGNPGTIGLDYAVSNHGAVRNVTIRSGDGQGVAGISMKRRIPGPGYIKNVLIEGFDVGFDIGDIQYGMTLEHVTVRGQKTAGVRADKNVLHVRKLQSENTVPAVVVTDRQAMLTLLDSDLGGGSESTDAVNCAGAALLRNVSIRGYRGINLQGEQIAGGLIKEVAVPPALGEGGVTLAVKDAPEYWSSDPKDWEPVGERREGESDDTAAIQRALDSGRGTVYFRPGRTYFLSDTVVLRGKVRHVLGMGSEVSLGGAKEPFGNRESPRPLFRIDPTEADVVTIENVFVNAQYPGEVIFENNTPATLVIRHCGGWAGADGARRSYRNTPNATGEVFVEDVFLPGWEFRNQKVWARQFNPENFDSDGTESQVTNDGGELWVLGFKTEGAAPFLASTNGARTELLGGYNYISATHAPSVPPEAVPYIVKDSEASLTFASDNFRDNDYRTYIRVIRDGKVSEFRREDLPGRNGVKGFHSTGVSLFRASSTSE